MAGKKPDEKIIEEAFQRITNGESDIRLLQIKQGPTVIYIAAGNDAKTVPPVVVVPYRKDTREPKELPPSAITGSDGRRS